MPSLTEGAAKQPGTDSKADVDPPAAATEAAGEDAMIAEMAYPVSAGAGSDAVPPSPSPDAATPAQPDAPKPAAPKPAAPKPAAQWDRATDTVRFDWAEIERTASQDGANQVMAKLLVAARAEGANSRWPL